MNAQIKKELGTDWRRAKRAKTTAALATIVEEASGLLDYVVVGDTVLVRPSHLLFGRTRHKPIELTGKAAWFFVRRMKRAEEGW